MREIIVDRENGAKAFVLFELTKGNIAEIKDRYILEQLRSAIDSPCNVVERGRESRAKSFCQFLRSMRRKKLQKDA